MGLIANTLVVVVALSAGTWAFDRQCVDFSSVTIAPDYKWVTSIPRWYMPVLSRETAQGLARTLLNRAPEQMNPNDLIFQSCFVGDVRPDPVVPELILTGYGGARKNITVRQLKRTDVVDMCNGEVCERGYSTMTDNQTYLVMIFCMSTGDAKWLAFTTVKTLPEPTKQLIFQHVENLGFKRENFIEQRWDYCPPV